MDQLTELLAHLHTGAAAFEPASPMPDVGASTSHLRDAPSAERKVKVMPVVIACAVCAISDLNFSMLVPFFPEAAERHGCTPTVTGMLFGLHQVVALLVTPVAPFLCQRFGGAGVLRAACFLQAATAFSFAFTDLATTTTSFVVACASLRAVQGLAAGLSEVAAVGLLMRSVPSELVGDAIGWSEAARGVGIMIGPLIGGGLDEAIGYEAPFFCGEHARAACTLHDNHPTQRGAEGTILMEKSTRSRRCPSWRKVLVQAPSPSLSALLA